DGCQTPYHRARCDSGDYRDEQTQKRNHDRDELPTPNLPLTNGSNRALGVGTLGSWKLIMDSPFRRGATTRCCRERTASAPQFRCRWYPILRTYREEDGARCSA